MENKGIMGFFDTLLNPFRTSEIEDAQAMNIQYLKELKLILDHSTEINPNWQPNGKHSKELIESFYKAMARFGGNFKSRGKNPFLDLSLLLNYIIPNAELIEKELRAFRGVNIVPSALSFRELNIVRSVAHFSFLVNHAFDFTDVIAADEMNSSYKVHSVVSKRLIESMVARMPLFATVLSVYGQDPSKLKRELDTVSKHLVSDETNERIQALDKRRLDILDFGMEEADNFLGSPILAFRSWLAVGKAEQYHKLQEQTAELKLRINYWESLKDGNEKQAEIEETIIQLQERVEEAQIEIREIERSAGL